MKRRRCTKCKHTMKGHKRARCKSVDVLYLAAGAKYVGATYEDKPSGHGILETEESTYKGYFLSGKRHGFGIELRRDGMKYEGEWRTDLYHGKGKLFVDNEVLYEGTFNTGTYHGDGKIVRLDSSYEGQWNHGTYHGRGRHTTPKGTFEGEFYYNVRHGSGTFTEPNGNVYTGRWRRGLREGNGIYTTDDGTYTGEWTHDLQSGHGRWVSNTHGIYVGQFKRGKRHRKGTQTWPDGTVYTGGWSRGVKTGHGIQTFCDGSSYNGFWLKDQYSGTGTLTMSGSSFKGSWEHGKREGEFEETRPDGSISIGPWVNDVRHGTFLKDEIRTLYIWHSLVDFSSTAAALQTASKLMRSHDYQGARVVLLHHSELLTWTFFWKYDLRGVLTHLLSEDSLLTILQKHSWKLFKAKRYEFLERLFGACPVEKVMTCETQAAELFDIISKEFVANPWIVRDQSYSKGTRTKLLKGIFLGEFGRCPPKDPFTRLPLTKNSGSFLAKDKKKANEIYTRFMASIGKQPTIRAIARSFDVQDFEEMLKNAREANDRDTIKRVMKERNDYLQSRTEES